MTTELGVGDIRKHRGHVAAVTLFEGAPSPGGATGAVDKAIGGAITAAIHDGDFHGKWGETLFLRPGKWLASPRVLVVGLGKKEKFTPDHVRQLALPVMRMAKKKKISTVASVLHGAGAGGFDPEETARFLALGAVLSEYEYDRYKSEKEGRVSRFQVVEREKAAARKVARGLAHGARLGEGINWGRDLVASPPGDLRPDGLARAARKIAGGKVRVRVYGRKEAEAWKMGGLIAVGKGSEVSPRLIVAEDRGGRPARRGAPDDVGQDGGGALHRRRGKTDPGGRHHVCEEAVPPGRHPRRRPADRIARGGPGQRHDGDDGQRREGPGTDAGGLRVLGGTRLGVAAARGIPRADQERYRRPQEHRGAGGRGHHGRLFPEGIRRGDPLGPSGHRGGGVEREGENGVRPRPDRGAGAASRGIPAERRDGGLAPDPPEANMPDMPPRLPTDKEYTSCPHCTIQIPANVPVCPHCEQILLPHARPRRPRFFAAGPPAPAVLWERHGKWVMVAGPGPPGPGALPPLFLRRGRRSGGGGGKTPPLGGG